VFFPAPSTFSRFKRRWLAALAQQFEFILNYFEKSFYCLRAWAVVVRPALVRRQPAAPVATMMRRLRSWEMRLQRVLPQAAASFVLSRVCVCVSEVILIFKLVATDFFDYALARKRADRYLGDCDFRLFSGPC
jgi:hypothetical protein